MIRDEIMVDEMFMLEEYVVTVDGWKEEGMGWMGIMYWKRDRNDLIWIAHVTLGRQMF